MKKALIILSIIFLIGCSKDSINEPTKKEVDIVFYSYEYYLSEHPYPSSVSGDKCSKTSSKIYFFNAEDITAEIKKEEFYYENVYDHDSISYTYEALRDEGKLILEDGNTVNSITINTKKGTPPKLYERDYASLELDISQDSWNDLLTHNVVTLPLGEYYIVATHMGTYGRYYSGRFISVTPDLSFDEKRISIAFPSDGYYEGYFDWITPVWE